MKRLALGLIGLFLATAAYAQEVVYYHADALGMQMETLADLRILMEDLRGSPL